MVKLNETIFSPSLLFTVFVEGIDRLFRTADHASFAIAEILFRSYVSLTLAPC